MANDFNTIGFIGLGLIGGGIAKRIRAVYPDTTIIGYDVDKEALKLAVADKTLDKIAGNVDNSFSDCDLIFLCAPTSFNIGYLKPLKDIIKTDCILTDVGSVKTDIYEAVKASEMSDFFVGGHPMVGSEKYGYAYSKESLIVGAYYFITPSGTVANEKTESFSEFIKSLGAMPITYTPKEHDLATAYISHVPHAIAAGLVNMVKNADDDGLLKELAAGGFKDITRIASSSPVIWEHILLSNKENVLTGIDEYIGLLNSLKASIENDDGAAINSFFDSARIYRDSVPDRKMGVIGLDYSKQQ